MHVSAVAITDLHNVRVCDAADVEKCSLGDFRHIKKVGMSVQEFKGRLKTHLKA